MRALGRRLGCDSVRPPSCNGRHTYLRLVSNELRSCLRCPRSIWAPFTCAHAVAPAHFSREGDAYRFSVASLKVEVLTEISGVPPSMKRDESVHGHIHRHDFGQPKLPATATLASAIKLHLGSPHERKKPRSFLRGFRLRGGDSTDVPRAICRGSAPARRVGREKRGGLPGRKVSLE